MMCLTFPTLLVTSDHLTDDLGQQSEGELLVQTQLRVNEVQDQVDALVKSRDLSEQAYRAGSITLTDVLADSQLLTARDESDSSRANAARAAVGVYRALGGGWTPGTSNTQPPRKSSGE
jgi:outer membrane protein TolC